MRVKFVSFLICVLVLLSFLACERICPSIAAGAGTDVDDSVSPVIQDFYINNTWAGQPCQFSFNVTESVALDKAIFGCNATQTFVNETALSLSGTQAWVNATETLPSFNCLVSFQLWVWNKNLNFTTTELRHMKVYTYNSTPGAWNTPFISLGSAITTIEAANNWSATNSYPADVLNNNVTSLQTMIDNYASAQDWRNVLAYSATCNKLWYNNVPNDVQTDIKYALGNYTMVDKLPYTDTGCGFGNDFSVESKWALYGYYFNAQSWTGSYQNNTKWNITAAYNQFNSSVSYAVHTYYHSGLPLWMYLSGSTWVGATYTNRYYDEDACTLECYLLFTELLNVSAALKDCLYWWNYVNVIHWNSAEGYYGYTGTSIYECEAPFFYKITSELKYYSPSLDNWSNVLTDIGNRFLSSEWNSAQWLGYGHTGYVVEHVSDSDEGRLENTLGAWQALLGVYLQLNSTYQNDMADMLYGNSATEPAWTDLLNPVTQLYNDTIHQFRMYYSDSWIGTNNPTAEGEILMFMLGIVPATTTIAFPLEELGYEYIQDIDPALLQLCTRYHSIEVPLSGAGTMTFQYGVSPVTYNFNQSGVWKLGFSDSWNLITNVTYISALPTNRVYFMHIYTRYDATINAHCVSERADVSVQIAMDGSPTGHTTLYTFTGLTGTHAFTVPTTDPSGHPFEQWSTGETATTITVSSGGTYTAYYGVGAHDVAVTNAASSKTVVDQGYGLNIIVTTADLGDYPETLNVTIYANTTYTASQDFTLSSGNSTNISFTWNTTGFVYGNYTMWAYVWPVQGETNTVDNNCTGGLIAVTIPGDINGDFKVDLGDLVGLALAYNSKPGDARWNPNADIDDSGQVELADLVILAQHYNQHYP